MGFAALNPSYGTLTAPHACSRVGWVERSETHHVTTRVYTVSSKSAAPRPW